ncbi:CocE/NonD family hydrolase [Aeromicrobium wangtongii]|nr:CocE/NonD family hydrolase [Aeromicrobium wangtongii]MCD9197907.1 CocE/NonD family hydrolase [Aeromicrobium wangtongii]
MRDGVRLATEVWLPREEGRFPTLIHRTPYDRRLLINFSEPLTPSIFRLLDAGYAVIHQDLRGTGDSEGEFVPSLNDRTDGPDTIDWVTRQDWSDGSTGMFGSSFDGFVQWDAAYEGAEGLRAIAPVTSSADRYKGGWYSAGGGFSLNTAHMWTAAQTAALVARSLTSAPDAERPALEARVENLVSEVAEPKESLESMPWRDAPAFQESPWWAAWADHPARDDYWQNHGAADRIDQIQVPALIITGWYDLFCNVDLGAFQRLRESGASEDVRGGSRLVVGPWHHGYTEGRYPDRSFTHRGDASMMDLSTTFVAFYDRWLREKKDSLDGVAPVKLFVMGINEWRDELSWPLPDTKYVDYFLSSTSGARSVNGDGKLSSADPAADGIDMFVCDPQDPVLTRGGRSLFHSGEYQPTGPANQAEIEQRGDVLCYSTSPLDDPIEVTGAVEIRLHVQTSARDTDFHAKLVDVYPDGRAILLTEGMLRLRYRDSLESPSLATPGETYEITVEVGCTSNVFLPGHQIRVEIAGSNFPRYDRNTNTGGHIAAESAAEAIVADNSVLHGPSHPSRLVLPIIDRQ